jgi:hypothetical protein
VSSTKQRKRRRRRRLVLFLALGGVGYAVRRARGEQAGQPAGRPDFGAPASNGPRPPARATSATPRPAAEKLVEKPTAEPATKPAVEPPAPAEPPAATTARPAAAEAPHGPDSHAALEDGAQPEGFPIKGNADSMLYHVPGSSFYSRTVAEVWFRSAEAAQAAGFQLPPSQREQDKPNPQPVAETIPGTEALDPPKKAPAKAAPAKKAPAKTVAAKKAPAKKTVAKKAAPAKKAPPPAPEG